MVPCRMPVRRAGTGSLVVHSEAMSGSHLMTRAAWRELLGKSSQHWFQPEELLYEQESPGDSLWLVRTGTVELYRSFFGERHRLLYVSRGAMLGEGELFEPHLRTATARAVTRVRAHEVAGPVARDFLARFPELTLSLLRGSTQRTRTVEEHLVEQLVQKNLQLQMHSARVDPRMRRRVKDLEQTNEHLNQLAWVDALTGCGNRRALEKVLEMACEGPELFAVALFDVDHFKHYNDTHGHLEGDRALQALARLLQRRLRADDVLARYGGEEFCLILRAVSGEVAAVVCERLRQAITEFAFPFEAQQPLGDFTVSMGLAMYPLEGTTPSELLKQADERLYEAKRQGRNRLVGGNYAGL